MPTLLWSMLLVMEMLGMMYGDATAYALLTMKDGLPEW
jgi:hypothetical protein